MPARCLPAAPVFADTGAEELVWMALREALPPTALLVHSQVVIDGGQQREIDMVVCLPGAGVVCVEVKGGDFHREADGSWWQGGEPRGNPVTQVSNGMFSLKRWLADRAPGTAQARWAWALAFPHRDWSEPETPDLPRVRVLGRQDLGDLRAWVRRVVEGAPGDSLSTAAVDALTRVLAPRAPQTELLAAAARQRETVFAHATAEQLRVIQQFAANPRLLVVGGAGSGKTFLALERARQQTAAGLRVALVCYSRGLARLLQRAVEQWPAGERPAYVGLFHDLPRAWGASADEGEDPVDYYERFLPAELVRLAPGHEPFDAVVVDEAQDFGQTWWDSVMAVLRDPRSLSVFQDEGQRVFPRSGELPIRLHEVVLMQNVRNTREIATSFAALTPGGRQELMGPDGPVVEWRPCSAADALGAADDAVDELLEDWEPGQVALLTMGKRHPLQVEGVGVSWDAYWDEFFAGDSVFYGHVLGFKGLERDAVVLCLNGVRDPERARELVYVGLSRARQRLIVVGELPDHVRRALG